MEKIEPLDAHNPETTSIPSKLSSWDLVKPEILIPNMQNKSESLKQKGICIKQRVTHH